METKKRDTTIDFLRGIAVFAMILIHTSYYFLSNAAGLFFWNYAQFAVQVFVYCSAYLFFRKPFVFTKQGVFSYLKKRFLRLLVPYYLFVAAYIVVDYFFHNTPIRAKYIFDSITVIGGVEIGWLVLLFIQFALLMPLIALLWQKFRKLFWGYVILSLIASVYLFFFTFQGNYRYVMWFPWSLICIVAILILQYGKSRFFSLGLLVLSVLIYITGYFYKLSLHQSTSLFDNKYPPNLYYIMYGIAGVIILMYLHKLPFFPKKVAEFIYFLSKYSYSLYFIHYTFLNVATTLLPHYSFTWYSFFAFVFIPSVIIQWGYVKLRQILVKPKELAVSS